MSKSSLANLPCLGSFLKSNHLLVNKKNLEETKRNIQTFKQSLPTRKPFVIYLFPEGTTMSQKNLEISQQRIGSRRSHWKHLLGPKGGVISEIAPLIDGKILDMTFFYPKTEKRDETHLDLFLEKFPRNIYCGISDKTHLFKPLFQKEFDTDKERVKAYERILEEIWDKKEQDIESFHYHLEMVSIEK